MALFILYYTLTGTVP